MGDHSNASTRSLVLSFDLLPSTFFSLHFTGMCKTVKSQARLFKYTGSSEALLFADAIAFLSAWLNQQTPLVYKRLSSVKTAQINQVLSNKPRSLKPLKLKMELSNAELN